MSNNIHKIVAKCLPMNTKVSERVTDIICSLREDLQQKSITGPNAMLVRVMQALEDLEVLANVTEALSLHNQALEIRVMAVKEALHCFLLYGNNIEEYDDACNPLLNAIHFALQSLNHYGENIRVVVNSYFNKLNDVEPNQDYNETVTLGADESLDSEDNGPADTTTMDLNYSSGVFNQFLVKLTTLFDTWNTTFSNVSEREITGLGQKLEAHLRELTGKDTLTVVSDAFDYRNGFYTIQVTDTDNGQVFDYNVNGNYKFTDVADPNVILPDSDNSDIVLPPHEIVWIKNTPPELITEVGELLDDLVDALTGLQSEVSVSGMEIENLLTKYSISYNFLSPDEIDCSDYNPSVDDYSCC